MAEPHIPSQLSTPSPAVSFAEAASASRVDSAVEVSPISPGIYGPLQRKHSHRIIPPSITGHGRLIRVHQTVPSWLGVLVVVGIFGWTVLCGIMVGRVLGTGLRGEL